MSWELVVSRKLMLMDRARNSGDLKRAEELRQEIIRIKKENGNGRDPEENVPILPAPKVKKVKKKEEEFYPCPCGCGGVPEHGVFMPGHDGRVCGQIRKTVVGKIKREDLNDTVREIYDRWEAEGRPGSEYHPKIKDVVKKIRGK